MTPKTQAAKTKIHKWDHHKLKCFCTANNQDIKEIIYEIENILRHKSDKYLITKIYKEIIKLNIRKNNLNKK
jgi:hypothetical protein